MANLLEGDIKLGKFKIPKAGIVLGGAVAVGIVGYAYWSRSRSVGTVEVDMTGGDPSIDPETGLPYYDQYGYGVQGVGIYDPPTGSTIGTGYGTAPQVVQTTNNAGWTQASVALLRAYGVEASVAAEALGRALAGEPLTPDQLNIFNTARALQGEPPDGFPPVRMVGNGDVPPTDDEPEPPSQQIPGASLGAIQQLRVVDRTPTTIRVEWGKIPSGSTSVVVFVNGKRVGTIYGHGFRVRGLKRNTKYTITIRPMGHDHGLGAAASVTARTER